MPTPSHATGEPPASVAPLSAARRFLSSTIGVKFTMAITGVVLFLFVIGHMLGNLQVFLGREKITDYAKFLHHNTGLLYGARAVLLACVASHVAAAIWVFRRRMSARPVGYQTPLSPEADYAYASRTMIVSGPIIALFVVYHLLHLTTGAAHPDFKILEGDPTADVYHNVIAGFQQTSAALVYIVAMGMLGLHLAHGVWSLFQTLGLNHPRYNAARRALAVGAGAILFLGNVSIPLAVMAGVLRE